MGVPLIWKVLLHKKFPHHLVLDNQRVTACSRCWAKKRKCLLIGVGKNPTKKGKPCHSIVSWYIFIQPWMWSTHFMPSSFPLSHSFPAHWTVVGQPNRWLLADWMDTLQRALEMKLGAQDSLCCKFCSSTELKKLLEWKLRLLKTMVSAILPNCKIRVMPC